MMELCEYPKSVKCREYEIQAIQIPIVYNKYGDHDPDGLLYVLKKDADRIKRKAEENFHKEIPQPYEEVQPLVIRANLGDVIKIHFSHSLKRNLSIHVQGLAYDVRSADGSFVGRNPDSTTGRQITYCWYAQKEGGYLFSDMGDTRGSEAGTKTGTIRDILILFMVPLEKDHFSHLLGY